MAATTADDIAVNNVVVIRNKSHETVTAIVLKRDGMRLRVEMESSTGWIAINDRTLPAFLGDAEDFVDRQQGLCGIESRVYFRAATTAAPLARRSATTGGPPTRRSPTARGPSRATRT